MKFLIGLFLIINSVNASGPIECEKNNNPLVKNIDEGMLELEKTYVDSRQIAILDSGIFACITGEWTPVDAIHSDLGGLYVMAAKKPPNPNTQQWWCPQCNYCNAGWWKTCQREYGNGEKCGYPRPW